MKQIVLIATTLLILFAINYNIVKKEAVLRNGKTMLLRLAPVDPRSLMQGDYMILRYAMANEIPDELLKNKGCIVVISDKNNVASFLRIHDNNPLKENEHLLFYRNRNGLRLGAESFFFQEGNAKLYSNARYGELKVDESGTSVLAGLRGDDFSSLGTKGIPSIN
ncbi:MAG: GDYXXLXY domain-containing protein [Desulfobulbaceae bacterium]|nr:GDYXXLXY domain-containing protein [Desulfobulbaceae bacterium]